MAQQPLVYLFGDFTLETGSQVLRSRRDGTATTLPSRVFATLLCFVERPGEVLDKRALMQAVWPNVVVEDNNLEQQISTLRQLLGERRGENRYVVTVHGRGYRFVPPVSVELPPEQRTAPPSEPRQVEPPARLRSRLPRAFAAGALSIAVLAGAAVLVGAFGSRGSSDAVAPTARSLAVLPFRPLAAADRNESLELGMAETLIMALQGEALAVRPLSSVRRYMDPAADALAAGRALGVDSVLEGTIQQAGERLRVSARLLGVDDGRVLWSERYDLPFTDLLDMQDAIGARVRAALLPGSDAPPSVSPRRFTNDAEAYQLYANGRYHRQHRLNEAGLRDSIGFFEAAIERDPQFALAYVGLAESYSLLGVFGVTAPDVAFPPALAAVRRALELAPDLGEAYASLGHIKSQYEQDWTGAEQALRRALELAPYYAPAQQWYGHYLAYTGQIEAGLEQIRKAQALEPTSPSYSALIGMFLCYQRRYDEAIEHLERTVAMDPEFDITHTYLALAYMRSGNFERAAEHLARPRSTTPGSASYRGQLYALSGRRDEALAEAERLIALGDTQHVNAYDIAAIYGALGDVEPAFLWLERAFGDRSQLLGWLPWDPAFDVLRADPRYPRLAAKLAYR